MNIIDNNNNIVQNKNETKNTLKNSLIKSISLGKITQILPINALSKKYCSVPLFSNNHLSFTLNEIPLILYKSPLTIELNFESSNNFAALHGNNESSFLNSTYAFEKMRVFFGYSNLNGSIHAIDGNFAAGEIQLHHFLPDMNHKSKLNDNHPRKVVISAFLEVGEYDNPLFKPLLKPIKKNSSSCILNPYKILPTEWDDFLSYDTIVEECNIIYYKEKYENNEQNIVSWIVRYKPLLISYKQLRILRNSSKDSMLSETNTSSL